MALPGDGLFAADEHPVPFRPAIAATVAPAAAGRRKPAMATRSCLEGAGMVAAPYRAETKPGEPPHGTRNDYDWPGCSVRSARPRSRRSPWRAATGVTIPLPIRGPAPARHNAARAARRLDTARRPASGIRGRSAAGVSGRAPPGYPAAQPGYPAPPTGVCHAAATGVPPATPARWASPGTSRQPQPAPSRHRGASRPARPHGSEQPAGHPSRGSRERCRNGRSGGSALRLAISPTRR